MFVCNHGFWTVNQNLYKHRVLLKYVPGSKLCFPSDESQCSSTAEESSSTESEELQWKPTEEQITTIKTIC